MSTLTAFLIGLLIGWLAELLIDFLYWRKDSSAVEDLQPALNQAEQKIKSLQQELETKANKVLELEHVSAEADQMRVDVEALKAQVIDLTQKAKTVILTKSDHLERVNGIGPAFAKKLNAAGINTFAELAQLTPEKVEEIIQPKNWQKIEADEWIQEAKSLAEAVAESIEEVSE